MGVGYAEELLFPNSAEVSLSARTSKSQLVLVICTTHVLSYPGLMSCKIVEVPRAQGNDLPATY